MNLLSTKEVKKTLKESTKQEVDTSSELDGLYIYFSYDLVNSTKFKTANSDTWPSVIHWFYDLVYSGLKNRIDRIHIWRSVGDELLLYKKILSKYELDGIAAIAHEVLLDTIHRLHDFAPSSKNLISVKSTIWAAYANYIPPQQLSDLKNDYKNIIVYHDSNPNNNRLDFLGPDIDVGFRIAEHSLRSRLVVGSQLAYLLFRRNMEKDPYDENHIKKKLKIVSYEKLKGIWNERYYPIIWYEPEWNKAKDSFLYDERFDSKLIDKIVNADENGLDSVSKLNAIFKDLGKETYIEEIWEGLLSETSSSSVSEDFITPIHNIELHCVAICFNKENEILIAKRKESKKILPGIWEFGCGQLKMFDSFESCLKRSYKEDFDADLKFDDPIKPVATFYLNSDDDKKIPGIIFIAKVLNPKEIMNKRHDKIDWFNIDRFNHEFDEGQYVPRFKENVQLANKMISTINLSD